MMSYHFPFTLEKKMKLKTKKKKSKCKKCICSVCLCLVSVHAVILSKCMVVNYGGKVLSSTDKPGSIGKPLI